MQAKFGWHFENLAYTPDCLDTADAERIRNDGVIRQLLDEEMDTLKVRGRRNMAWLHRPMKVRLAGRSIRASCFIFSDVLKEGQECSFMI